MHIRVQYRLLEHCADALNDHEALLCARNAELNGNLPHKDALLKEK
jgi:hypothetical protein